MEFTKEQMLQLEELGETQFSIDDCAIILDVDKNKLADEVSAGSKIGRQYEKGRLMAEGEVRKSILKQAKQGSTPAQKQMLEIIKANKAAARKNKTFDLPLCVFIDPADAKKYYKKTDTTKLFASVDSFKDSDNNIKYKIKPIKKISALTIDLGTGFTAVYDDDIRFVFNVK